MRRGGNPEQAISIYDTAIKIATDVLDRRGEPLDRSNLAALLNNKAIALRAVGQDSGAAELLSQAVPLQAAALEAEPSQERFRSFLCNHYTAQIDAFLALEQWENAAEAAKLSRELWENNENELYRSACRLARVAAAIGAGANRPSGHAELMDDLISDARAALEAAYGPDVDFEEAARKNEVLEILRMPVADASDH
jgi:tetratricopeptide (TPR) repeat protein